ncbi:7694_t:CDS:2, partial [Scutellospora calospora]
YWIDNDNLSRKMILNLRIFSRLNFTNIIAIPSSCHDIKHIPIILNKSYSSSRLKNINHRFFSTPVTTSPLTTSEKKRITTKIKIRPLPEITSKTPRYITYGIIGISFWATAIALSFNYQRINSSTVQGSLFDVKHNPKAIQHLGKNINFSAPQWWPFPSEWTFPWISGDINHLKGVVDFKYWVKGNDGKGIVRFYSIRQLKDGGKWKIVEFTLTTEDGKVISLVE